MLQLRVMIAVMTLCLVPMVAWSASFNEITIYDGISNPGATSGWTGHSGWWTNREDNELEPGTIGGQAWDLEAFLVSQNKTDLILVGGWDFADSLLDTWAKRDVHSGDLFLAAGQEPLYGTAGAQQINAPVIYSDGNPNLSQVNWFANSNYGYSHVLHVDWDNPILDLDNNIVGFDYNAYYLGDTPQVQLAAGYYGEGSNEGANPWRYVVKEDSILLGSGTVEYRKWDTSTELNAHYGTDLWGWSQAANANAVGIHYTLTFSDLLTQHWLGGDAHTPIDLWTHFTMECGNDSIMGLTTATPVPEPMTMVMLGSLGAGMFAARKLRRNRKQ